MTELLTAAQMRAIEQAAIASGEVTGLELMERAGRGVVDAVFEEWPELAAAPHRAVVLCGPGNNGGDGFVVARLLKQWGWEVEVFLYGDPDKLPPDARTNCGRWEALGQIRDVSNAVEASALEPDLVVDALFGTGLTRPVSGLGAIFLDMQEERRLCGENGPAGIAHVAVDIPSGICSDSGRTLHDQNFKGLSDGVAAASAAGVDLTVTFHAMKLGHVLGDGPFHCGKVRVCDIGLRPGEGSAQLSAAAASELRKRSGNKFDHGHAMVLSGGPGRTGAARLAARGALRIGAGLVTLGVPPAAQSEAAAQLTAIMLARIGDAVALEAMLDDDRINALCLGPGLGLSEVARGLIEAGLMSARHAVLDADALTLIGRDATLFAALHDKCVLTPHAGEFARLFPDIAEKLNAPAETGPAFSKVDATREAAKQAGCTILFKGPDTVIADPSGRCAINSAHYDRAAPWLATAGSGDVLAGFITGLLARGFEPMQAAETGAWLHVECALKFGPGLIAEDLPEMLPKVFADLGL